MSEEEILTYSKKMRGQASALLESTNVEAILKQYGTVNIIGSYPLDLMWDPDIDIVVKADDIYTSAVNALNDIITRNLFQKVEFGDFVTFSREGRPKGYILVLKKEFEGLKWEIEVWFLDTTETQVSITNTIRDALTKASKEVILKKKYERSINGKSKHELSSMEIYKACLPNVTVI